MTSIDHKYALPADPKQMTAAELGRLREVAENPRVPPSCRVGARKALRDLREAETEADRRTLMARIDRPLCRDDDRRAAPIPRSKNETRTAGRRRFPFMEI